MTKPIIVVKIPCKPLYVIQVAKRILNKMFNFLALLDIRVLIAVASDWPHIFLQPGCFCLAYKYLCN